MRVASFAIALVIAASVSLAGQPGLKSSPVTLKFVNTPLSEVLDFIGRIAEIEIEFDEAVPQEVRDQKMETVAFYNTDLELVLKLITSHNGLTFDVVDEKTIYIRVEK